jgi:CelD/BcsL family acetyltransferase involved in cellulose biosynthesis
MVAQHRDDRSRATGIERMPYEPRTWDEVIARYPDAEVFHSTAWLAFLTATQRAEPVVAIVRQGDRPVGHFVGAIVRRYGIRILGSPLPGWGTQVMGFLLEPDADRRGAAEALIDFAFGVLGCMHLELADRGLTADDMSGSGYRVETGRTFVVDLQPSEDRLLSNLDADARRKIRRALGQGLRSEVAVDEGFADEFYGYQRAIFARQGLVPTYDVERVRQLIRHVLPSGQLLLMRILDPHGNTIAAGIVLGGRRTAVMWGIGYDRTNAEFHPIELLWWDVLRYWREHGSLRFDLGGGGEYKKKYGGPERPTFHFSRSRYAGLRYGRDGIRRLVAAKSMIAGRRDRLVASGTQHGTADPADAGRGTPGGPDGE